VKELMPKSEMNKKEAEEKLKWLEENEISSSCGDGREAKGFLDGYSQAEKKADVLVEAIEDVIKAFDNLNPRERLPKLEEALQKYEAIKERRSVDEFKVYTPVPYERNCGTVKNPGTHWQGCDCHEERHRNEIETLKSEIEKLKSINPDCGGTHVLLSDLESLKAELIQAQEREREYLKVLEDFADGKAVEFSSFKGYYVHVGVVQRAIEVLQRHTKPEEKGQ
jgi:hypothetical protein